MPKQIFRTLRVAAVLAAPILLSGCVTGPVALIPPTVSMVWDAARGDEADKTGPLSVTDMLAKFRNQDPTDEDPEALSKSVRQELRFTWNPDQNSLNLAQKAKLFTALANLPDGPSYLVDIRTSRATAANPLMAMNNGIVRARAAISELATDDRFDPEIRYDPSLSPDTMVITIAPAPTSPKEKTGA